MDKTVKTKVKAIVVIEETKGVKCVDIVALDASIYSITTLVMNMEYDGIPVIMGYEIE